jgi:hypothetical protein
VLRARADAFFLEIQGIFSMPDDCFYQYGPECCFLWYSGVTTMSSRGNHSVTACTVGTQQDRVTVALAVSSVGEKLTPFVVYRKAEELCVNSQIKPGRIQKILFAHAKTTVG